MSNNTILRDITRNDLPVFFDYQLDEDANQMAAFTAKDPTDRDAFDAHWARIMSDDTITLKTILHNDEVAGHIACHSWFGEPEVTYWVGKTFWGRGVATQALSLLLDIVEARPLYARGVADNVGSIRVLEKCGFIVSGHDRGFANARGEEVDEVVLRLD